MTRIVIDKPVVIEMMFQQIQITDCFEYKKGMFMKTQELGSLERGIRTNAVVLTECVIGDRKYSVGSHMWFDAGNMVIPKDSTLTINEYGR